MSHSCIRLPLHSNSYKQSMLESIYKGLTAKDILDPAIIELRTRAKPSALSSPSLSCMFLHSRSGIFKDVSLDLGRLNGIPHLQAVLEPIRNESQGFFRDIWPLQDASKVEQSILSQQEWLFVGVVLFPLK